MPEHVDSSCASCCERAQASCYKEENLNLHLMFHGQMVFIRELISNGSDALEKLQHKMITAGGDTAPMEIHLQTDAAKGTFTIQSFLEALHNQAEASSSIIGQFGVGFYSTFMVPDKVDIYFQSTEQGTGYKWSSDSPELFSFSKWQHKEFYHQDKPLYTLHYRTDAPFNIRSIFYVPERSCTRSSLKHCTLNIAAILQYSPGLLSCHSHSISQFVLVRRGEM
ncbi:hypothetical protein QQF64_025463 [Cirrhinus molitorella]|uniref:Uncharacterized protein n=1 Tax=Cirrhinus molitorella TaxID=172907 RepID=A0ABR3NP27_9TELE